MQQPGATTQRKAQNDLLALAGLLEYPGEAWRTTLKLCAAWIEGDAAAQLAQFAQQTEELPLAAMQELYTQTFDLNPVATLEIGYHLFGENYKRGLFLAQLRETEAQFALDEPHQLPDYLPMLLRLLVRLDDRELHDDLIIECVLPALAKMKQALCSKANPYAALIAAVEQRLQAEAPARCSTARARELNVLPQQAELRFIG
jgi:nitrate reductase delta subunit